MHAFTIAAAAVLVGLSNAQTGGNIPGIPECAGGCIGNFGGCGALDADCICNNSDLITNLACCVSVQCDEDDQETTLSFAQGICASYDADLPQSASCAPGAESTPPGGSSTGLAAASSAVTSGSSGSMATTTMSGSATDTAMTTGLAAGPTSGMNTEDSTAASATDASASASASASETPNVGAVKEIGFGLAFAGLVAAI